MPQTGATRAQNSPSADRSRASACPSRTPAKMFATAACPSRGAGSGQDAMVAGLKAKVFPDEALKVLALVDGRKVVRVV